VKRMRFGLIGCGAMGSEIAKAFDGGAIRGDLAYVFDAAADKSKTLAEKLRNKPEISPSAVHLIVSSDFVIEAASQDAVREYAQGALKAGRDILIMSVGALLDGKLMEKLKAEAAKTGASIYLPSGALAGVDGLLSAACGRIDEVTLTTTKPPNSLKGVKYLIDRGVDVELITQPTVVFEGAAHDAVKHFPKNINVSAVVSLAAGRSATVRIIADPGTKTNNHEVTVKGDFGELSAKTTNRPSPANPATSHLASLAAVAALKKITGNVKIGN
jgi:aspartate dehydrogenase